MSNPAENFGGLGSASAVSTAPIGNSEYIILGFNVKRGLECSMMYVR